MHRALALLALIPVLLLPAACEGGDEEGAGTCPDVREPTFGGPGTICAETAAWCGSTYRITWGAPVEGAYELEVVLGDRTIRTTCPGDATVCGATLTCDGTGFGLEDEPVSGFSVLASYAEESLAWARRARGTAAAGSVPAFPELRQPNGPGCAPLCVLREWTTAN